MGEMGEYNPLGGRRVQVTVKPVFPIEQAAANLEKCIARGLPKFHEIINLGKSTGPVALIGGGPSLNTQLDNLRNFPGPRVVCGSAHDHLVRSGIVCEYAVFLDPHWVMADWLTAPQKGTHYLIASSCDPSIFDRLEGYKVITWHPAMIDPETGRNLLDVRGEPIINGGDGVILRAWPLMAVMGHRDFHFYGFDCSFPIDCEGQHAYDYKFFGDSREEPIGVTVEGTGERFISCPGWIMQLQEFCKMLEWSRGKFDITIHGESLAASTLCKGTMKSAPERFAEGMNALLDGDLKEGFSGLEYRQGLRGTGIPLPGGKEWLGEDLRGKTLLLHGEQGHGDMIMVLRYVPVLVQCGADVVMVVHKAIRPLAARIPGVRTVGDDERWPEYDYWLGMMSLPHRFGQTLETLLNPLPMAELYDQKELARFQEIIARTARPGKLNVGVCWAGSGIGEQGAAKQLPVDLVSRMVNNFYSATWYGLQVPPDKRVPVIDLSPHLDSFLDTAHAIANLDLVITADTAVAHMAG